MSKFATIKVKCAICGKKHEFRQMSSSCFLDESDLDNRPAMMMRATISFEIQMCTQCHYSNYNLGKRVPGMKHEILKSEEYLAVVNDDSLSSTAKAFWLASIIYGKAGDRRTTGYLALKAAWYFDDACDKEHAKLMREKAIKCFEYDIAPVYHCDVNLACIIIDMKRRIGDFDGAVAIAEYLLNLNAAGHVELKEVIVKVLEFQIKLCKAGYTSCYTISHALGKKQKFVVK